MNHAASRPFSVGLTGGIGSGKSLVADLFAERGAVLIDTDCIAHGLTAPQGKAMTAIRATFGEAFVQADGALDRTAMRQHIFAMPTARQTLEAILHPLIRTEADRAAQAASGSYPMFVVPLLVESAYWRARVDRILVVDCPEALQVARVRQRNALSEEQVRAIMAAQATRTERLRHAHDIIVNDRDIPALLPQVARLHAAYCALAAERD